VLAYARNNKYFPDLADLQLNTQAEAAPESDTARYGAQARAYIAAKRKAQAAGEDMDLWAAARISRGRRAGPLPGTEEFETRNRGL